MRLLRRKRGVSGIISGLFLVASCMLLFGAFYWQYVAQDHYNQVMLARLNREWERLNERLLISEVQTGTATLRFNITNYGAVSANVTDLYLTNRSATPVWQWRYSLSVWINPGTKIYLNTNVSIAPSASYQFKIATQRGNTFAPTEGTIINQLQPGSGQNFRLLSGSLENRFSMSRQAKLGRVPIPHGISRSARVAKWSFGLMLQIRIPRKSS